jgi:general stress protein 26
MEKAEVLQFMRTHSLGVQASVSGSNSPQAAVVGFVVTDNFEIIFDTVATTRKVVNLRQNPRCAFVIGGVTEGDERTVQYAGVADEPAGDELADLRELYFARFPDGRERQRWPGLTYVRIKPQWLRYSDWNQVPPLIVEFEFLRTLP